MIAWLGRRVQFGHKLPFAVPAEQPFERPLHFETCQIASASNAADLAVHDSPIRSISDDWYRTCELLLRPVRNRNHA